MPDPVQAELTVNLSCKCWQRRSSWGLESFVSAHSKNSGMTLTPPVFERLAGRLHMPPAGRLQTPLAALGAMGHEARLKGRSFVRRLVLEV